MDTSDKIPIARRFGYVLSMKWSWNILSKLKKVECCNLFSVGHSRGNPDWFNCGTEHMCKIFSEAKNWHDAEAVCNGEFGHLASILSLTQDRDPISRSAAVCPHKWINSCLPWQNGRHFADKVFKFIFVKEKFCISIKIWLKLVSNGLTDNNPALV